MMQEPSQVGPGACPPWPVYGLSAAQKQRHMAPALSSLTRHHASHCAPYQRILQASGIDPERDFRLEDLPYLPVRLFKEDDLLSVGREEVFKTLSSSGTTSSRVSRIFLDRHTAQAQSRALVAILQSVLGKARLPMLILDHPGVIRDRSAFSARGAGILGLSTFGRDHTYALDEDMRLDMAAVDAFCCRHAGQPVLLFGFTFMVWKYFVQALKHAGITLDLDQAILLHSGGWKKMQDEAVAPEVFKAALRLSCGIRRVHNFYGMVEQVGSIFLECEHGHLHAPAFADLLVRDPADWSVCSHGQPGLIQVISVLPRSYPGHSLLTEDLGVILGEDDCPCGRQGKYFHVAGRMAQAEARGCSDTLPAPAADARPA